jgi:hypothetical protein
MFFAMHAMRPSDVVIVYHPSWPVLALLTDLCYNNVRTMPLRKI